MDRWRRQMGVFPRRAGLHHTLRSVPWPRGLDRWVRLFAPSLRQLHSQVRATLRVLICLPRRLLPGLRRGQSRQPGVYLFNSRSVS